MGWGDNPNGLPLKWEQIEKGKKRKQIKPKVSYCHLTPAASSRQGSTVLRGKPAPPKDTFFLASSKSWYAFDRRKRA